MEYIRGEERNYGCGRRIDSEIALTAEQDEYDCISGTDLSGADYAAYPCLPPGAMDTKNKIKCNGIFKTF